MGTAEASRICFPSQVRKACFDCIIEISLESKMCLYSIGSNRELGSWTEERKRGFFKQCCVASAIFFQKEKTVSLIYLRGVTSFQLMVFSEKGEKEGKKR